MTNFVYVASFFIPTVTPKGFCEYDFLPTSRKNLHSSLCQFYANVYSVPDSRMP